MELNIYQKNIIDKILHGHGNIMIQAFAGCGKTFTLIQIMKVLPQESKKLYCAFNKDIVGDITRKTNDIENLRISTIHSLGLSIIQRKYNGKIVVDEFKYSNHINKYISQYSEDYENFSSNEQSKFKANVRKLTTFCRNNLSCGKKGIKEIAVKFGISLIGDEINATSQILKWGKANIETIDYGDMVWLPNELPFIYPSFDYIFVDEAQDLSVAQQQLVLKCFNIKTRYIFCGDEFQSIYGFAGADSNSFNVLKNTPNTETMYLPICYRCDDTIVEFASQIVPSISKNGNNLIGKINFQSHISAIKDGDMVLCRNNAPLIKLYLDLIKDNKKCHILGNDFADDLIDMLNDTESTDINLNMPHKGVISELYLKLKHIVEQIEEFESCDTKAALNTITVRTFFDKIKTIEILSEGLNTKQELIDKINSIFKSSNESGISLSTIHKAKGLECNNVHILCWSLFEQNKQRIEADWEKQQEENIKYVAVTRAKHNLSLIEDEDFTKYSNNISLHEYEAIINRISKLHKIKQVNVDEISRDIEKIKDKGKNMVVFTLPNIDKNKSKCGNIISLKDTLKKMKKC